jgi:glycine/D-amino acid oxidase-like deaminating enzyme
MQVSTIGLDLAKNVFQLHGIDAASEVVITKKVAALSDAAVFREAAPCVNGMEACAMVLLPLSSYYLLAFEYSRVVVGATRETNSGFDYRLTAAGVAEVLNAGLAVAPGLAPWTLHEIRMGFRPIAHDNRPKLGPVPGVDNLLVGNGLGPSGLSMGPYSGALLANAMLGKPTELALGPFAVLK